jgi:hypothetical protein
MAAELARAAHRVSVSKWGAGYPVGCVLAAQVAYMGVQQVTSNTSFYVDLHWSRKGRLEERLDV